MISFDFKNSGVKAEPLAVSAKKLSRRVAELRIAAASNDLGGPERFMNLAVDAAGIKAVKAMVSRKASKTLGAVAVIGIGGSSLGAEAIASALGTKIPVVFINNVDPDSVAMHLRHLEYAYSTGRHVLVVPVSKSGTTMETSANFDAVINWLKGVDKKWRQRVVAVTDYDSPLYKTCISEGFDVLLSPPEISGRFSFFSAVGLFPLAAAGVEIEAMLRGASSMARLCLHENVSDNPALRGAATIFRSGKAVCNNFVFSDKLERLGIFAKNLMAESLGKDGKGITTLVSVGAIDLHSMGQLYFGGPRDKFTVFVGAQPNKEMVYGKNLGEIIKAIYSAVRQEYRRSGLPHYSIDLGRISPHAVGEFMMMKMFETVYLAYLMGVNAFGQPAVESYKKTARRMLGK